MSADVSGKLVLIPSVMTQPEPGKPRRPLTGDAAFLSQTGFAAREGKVESGIWESSAGSFQSNTTGYVEFGHILEGSARLIDPDGTVHQLTPGTSFIMPEGYTGHWEVDERVKKVYFITRF